MRMNPSPAKTTIPHHQFATGFGRAYLGRMLTLPLLDIGVTGIFILVTKRFDVVGVALSGLLLLGLAAYISAWWLYRPIASYGPIANYRAIAPIDSLTPPEIDNAKQAVARIQQLPHYSALAAALLVLIYSFTAAALGVYTPPEANLGHIPQHIIILALLFYASVYAAFYSYFIYFFVNDLTIKMRRDLRDVLSFEPISKGLDKRKNRGGLAQKLGSRIRGNERVDTFTRYSRALCCRYEQS